jgi:hypothetical protein
LTRNPRLPLRLGNLASLADQALVDSQVVDGSKVCIADLAPVASVARDLAAILGRVVLIGQARLRLRADLSKSTAREIGSGHFVHPRTK